MTTVVNPQEIVDTLKNQHIKLGADLTGMLDVKKDGKGIIDDLSIFKSDLMEHLALENEVFYPDYLDRKRKIKEDILATQDFMDLMGDIAVAVTTFLEKYSTLEAIDTSRAALVEELTGIINILNVRIKAEEDVFNMYLRMCNHTVGVTSTQAS